jgi:alpha-tubulin suppressor-like RCC1 family protein
MHRALAATLALAAAAAVALAACDPGTGPSPAAASVQVVAGNEQTATVGTALPLPVVVQVMDEDGGGIEGSTVVFRVISGGGTVAGGTARTDAEGLATEQWTLGTAAGEQRLEARVLAADGTPLMADTIVATARAAAPAQLEKTGGDGQSGTAGQPLPAPLAVRVRDAFGNPVSGAAVQWQVASGGGSVAPASSPTDANGMAQTQWTLGAAGGAGAVQAAVAGTTPVTFTATGAVIPAAQVEVVAGAGQTAVVGTELANPIVVEVRDAGGHPLAGRSVLFAVLVGGGSVRTATVMTGADGRASTFWTMGVLAGTQRLEARVADAGGVTLAADSVTATATPAAPSQIAITGGDGQTGTQGQPLPLPLGVRLRDPYGNVVPGIAVQWQVLTGGGSVQPATSTTDANGQATTVWTLGAGGGTVRASAPGVAPVTFTAGARPVPATFGIFSGNGQSGPAGALLSSFLVVRVADAAGNAVPGAAVTWQVAGGGGVLRSVQAVTDASGQASTRWELGPQVGAGHAVQARVEGITNPVTFTATASLPGSATLAKVAGDGQTGRARYEFALRPVIEARLADGRPLQNANITWAPNNGGTVQPRIANTNASGRTSTVWTAGAMGPQQLTATLGSRSVVFTAQATSATVVTLSPGVLELETGQVDTIHVLADGPEATHDATWQVVESTRVGLYTFSGNNETGVIVGRRPGTTRVIVSVGDGVDTLTVTVRPLSEPFVTFSSGFMTTCALTASGKMYCWGANIEGSRVTQRDFLSPVRMAEGLAFDWVSVGEGEQGRQGICAGTTNGPAWCWGGSTQATPGRTPAPLPGGHAWRKIDVGADHACGITTAGDAYCFGNGGSGRLGTGGSASGSTPRLVAGGMKWLDITAGSEHSCGIATTGAAYCWGSYTSTGRSDGLNHFVPAPVEGGHTFVQIDAGRTRTCAVDTGGTAWCWGDPYSHLPTAFGALAEVEVAPYAQGDLSSRLCGIEADGDESCAGAPTTFDYAHAEPFGRSSCAITTTSVIYCSGGNSVGQLGKGHSNEDPTLVRVYGQP